jgi:starch-binding outer membrane protein, SusD/RagB family
MILRNSSSMDAPRRGAPLMALGVLLLALTTGGCLDDLLTVDAPSTVLEAEIDHPAHAPVLVSSAIADFECAFGHYIVTAGLFGQEFEDSQQTAAQWDYDRRNLGANAIWYATNTCDDRLGTYAPLATARWAADRMLRRLQDWSDGEVQNRAGLLATMSAYSGYAHVLLGEGFCTMALDGGPELARQRVFELAVERFTTAIETAQAAGRSDILNMARVGRARARLNLGDRAAAAADAREVPSGFAKHAAFSEASFRSANRVFRVNNRDEQVSVFAAFREVETGGVSDPRVPVVNTGRLSTNQRTIMWTQGKYLGESAPIPIARWAEAQLIIAEAEGGQTAVDIINELRSRVDVPPFASTDPQEIMDEVVRERRRELFLESHHLGDNIRYNLPLEPAAGTPYLQGGVYGDQRCFPLPDAERLNNPNIGG